MARKPDPVALGRRLIKGPTYWWLVVARLLCCVPGIYSAWGYFRAAWLCFQVSAPLVFCAPDTLLPGVWAVVYAYMCYCSADGLMVRWIITYSRPAAFIRTNAFIFACFLFTHFMARISNASPALALQIWVINSCFLTFIYILQSFIASNLVQKTSERTLNLFRIAVYAVIPIGLASFISMLGLIRTTLLLQYHIRTSCPAASFLQ